MAKERLSIIKFLMAAKLRDTLTRKISQPPIDRFGVHFDYADLCQRLQALETSQDYSDPPAASKLRLRKALNPNHSVLATHVRPASKAKKAQLSSTLNPLTVAKSPLARSYTPGKLRTKAAGKKPVIKQLVTHGRQDSLPLLMDNPSGKIFAKAHKKSVSIFTSAIF